MKRIISMIVLLCMIVATATSCSVLNSIEQMFVEKEAKAIMVKTVPTVTSVYGENLAIADDGVLYVKYVDNSIAQIKIKLSMIDQTGFDKNSLEEQVLKITYGGQETKLPIKLTRPASSIAIKKAPTIQSYTDMPFAMGDDGVLEVTWTNGTKDEFPITMDMLDLSAFDNMSTSAQNVPVNYGGKTVNLTVTLVEEQIATSGTLNTFRFEAEDGEYGGDGWVDVEDCGGLRREDGSLEYCVKGLHQTEAGGFVIFRIVSDKKTEATIRISISKQADASVYYDEYTTFEVNGELIKTGIVLDNTSQNGWWDFVTYEIATTVVLKNGVNEICINTNNFAHTGVTSLAGRNINWIEIDAYGNCEWYVEEP